MAGGLTFCPPDHELITKFLRPKIADDTIKVPFIHDADVYSAAPPELAARHVPARGTDRCDGAGAVYYFFCPVHRGGGGGATGGVRRRQRTVDGGGANGEAGYCGCWHPEGGEKAVLDAGGRRVGHLRRLSYGVREKGSSRRFTRLGWCMTEFGIDHGGGGEAAASLVLCKMYRSPRAAQVEARQAATASSSGSKRKAADDLIHAPAARSRPHGMHHANTMPAGVDGDVVGSIHLSGQFHVKEDEQSVAPAPEEQTLVQTMDGPRSDHDVIMALAMGATVDDLLGPKHGEPGESSPFPAPEPCSISGGCGDIVSMASGVMPCPAPAPALASLGRGGYMAMALPAPPAGEFSWDKELAWIRELLSGSPHRVPACGQSAAAAWVLV